MPEQNLTFRERHPFLIQSLRDTWHSSKRQLIVSGILSLISVPVGMMLGIVPVHLGAAILTILMVYVGAILVAALVNFARAPFTVLANNQRRIAILEQSVIAAPAIAPPPAIQPVPRPAPNLVCLGRLCTLGEMNDNGVLEANADANTLLMMAEIKNEILDEREVGDADFVSAQIVYRGEGHQETVHHGCWLREQLNFSDVPTDAVRHLILVIGAPGHELLTLDNYNEGYNRLNGYRQIDLGRESYEIIVTVREGTRNVLTTQFRLDYNADAGNQEDAFNLVHLPNN